MQGQSKIPRVSQVINMAAASAATAARPISIPASAAPRPSALRSKFELRTDRHLGGDTVYSILLCTVYGVHWSADTRYLIHATWHPASSYRAIGGARARCPPPRSHPRTPAVGRQLSTPRAWEGGINLLTRMVMIKSYSLDRSKSRRTLSWGTARTMYVRVQSTKSSRREESVSNFPFSTRCFESLTLERIPRPAP
jgi:hypothetical protein